MPLPNFTVSVNPTPYSGQTYVWAEKDPADEYDYTLDLSAWLADSGCSIAQCSVFADPSLTITNLAFAPAAGTCTGMTMTITGGVDGQVPPVAFNFIFKDAQGNPEAMTVRVAVPVRSRSVTGLTLVATKLATGGLPPSDTPYLTDPVTGAILTDPATGAAITAP